ncbi:MAG: hypothetical protein QMD17_13675 [Rhodocyclaceae bacterium]|nr:hypothetical protein [Rhodocyclaceae bacterium]
MASSSTLDDHRTAQAEALAQAGSDERARREAELRADQLTVLLNAAEQRAQAEMMAEEQARERVGIEAQTRRLAIEQARAEQAAEAALRTRLETEELACAEARRKEQAMAELAAASAARAKREAYGKELAEETIAAERAALLAAHERLKSEQSAEILALARVAAEQEAARVATQRLALEREARVAAEARQQAEAEAQAAVQERTAAEQALAAEIEEKQEKGARLELNEPYGSNQIPFSRPPDSSLRLNGGETQTSGRGGWSGKRIGLLAAACIAAGILAGGWFGMSLSAKPVLSGDGQLRLDTRLTQPSPARGQ